MSPTQATTVVVAEQQRRRFESNLHVGGATELR